MLIVAIEDGILSLQKSILPYPLVLHEWEKLEKQIEEVDQEFAHKAKVEENCRCCPPSPGIDPLQTIQIVIGSAGEKQTQILAFLPIRNFSMRILTIIRFLDLFVSGERHVEHVYTAIRSGMRLDCQPARVLDYGRFDYCINKRQPFV